MRHTNIQRAPLQRLPNSTIDDWDQRFLLEKDDPLVDAFEQSGDGDSLVVLRTPTDRGSDGACLGTETPRATPRVSLRRLSDGAGDIGALCGGDASMPVNSTTVEQPADEIDGTALPVNGIFYSLQGEGKPTGTPSVFTPTSGCNLRC
jgi:hypothetical protein